MTEYVYVIIGSNHDGQEFKGVYRDKKYAEYECKNYNKHVHSRAMTFKVHEEEIIEDSGYRR